jgi:hypothetical protein
MSDDGTTVACPVERCAFRDSASLVAAHVNGSEDAAHDWDALRFGGPRDFLQQARRGWLDDGDGRDGDSSEPVRSKADDTSESSADDNSQAGGEKSDVARADATDPEPVPVGEVRCPADGCHYTDELASVKAHISGTHDAAHDSERLRERGLYPAEADVKRESGSTDPTAGTDGTEDPPTATDDTATVTRTDDTATVTRTDETRVTGETTVADLLDRLDAAESEALPVDTAAVETALVFCDVLTDLDADSDTRTLVDAYTLASDLSAAADDARTDLRDELLDRTDTDGELAGEVGTVRRVTRTRREMRDDDEVLTRLREAGVDTASVLRPDATRVRETLDAADLPESLAFEVSESAYVQKADSDTEARRARLAALRRRSEQG